MTTEKKEDLMPRLCKECGKELPAAQLESKPFAQMCCPCTEVTGKDVHKYKMQQISHGKSDYSFQLLPLGSNVLRNSLLRNP